MKAAQPDDVVRLSHAANAAQAHIVEQALRNDGIDCRVVGGFLEAGLGDVSNLVPEIWVHKNDLARAQAILEHRLREPVEKPWEQDRP